MQKNSLPAEKTKKKSLVLANEFFRHFDLIEANTEALREEVYKLRFQVYCKETGFERQEDCLCVIRGGREVWLEKDEYDARSVHYLLRHRRSGHYAATMRMVLCDPQDPAQPFPIEKHCTLKNPFTSMQERKKLAEISRFAVSKEFKRRRGEKGTLTGVSSHTEDYLQPDERRLLPHLTVGLFAAITRICHDHQIDYWYAVMEPFLIRLLRFYGIRFEPIGPEVDFHGKRTPYRTRTFDVLEGIRTTNLDVWNLITDFGKYSPKTCGTIKPSIEDNSKCHP